jgi:hypothetical protein
VVTVTLSELQSRLLDQLEESGTGFLTPDDAIRLLNDAVLDLSGASEFYHSAGSVNVSLATVVYDLATLLTPNIIAPIGVWNPRTKRWLRPIGVDQLDADNPRWQQVSGEPDRSFVRGLWNIGFYPRCTGALEIVYAAAPPKLTLPADVVPQLNEEYAAALVDGAMGMHYLEDREVSKAARYLEQWEDTKQRVRVWTANKLVRDRTIVLGSRS